MATSTGAAERTRPGTAAWWQALSVEVGRLDGVRSRLLTDHVADEHGGCRGCWSLAASPRWPCSLWMVANGLPVPDRDGPHR